MGQVVAVIGANGAGKSTLLKSIAGAMRSRRDAILFEGEPIGDRPAHEMVARGIALVPEGRRLFPSLTVEENLLIGGQLGRPGPWNLARIYALFPMLAERRAMPSAIAVRRPAADGRDRPRADVQSQAPAVRRDQPWPCADRHPRHLRPHPADRGRRHLADHRRAGHRAGAQNRKPCHCLQEGRVSLEGEAKSMSREKISAAYFGV